jgi:hypothetical protein
MSSASVQKQRVKQRRKDRQFIAWLVGGSLVVFLLLAALAWQGNRPGSTPEALDATASSALDESTLLPLAKPIRPIAGFHDMKRLPNGPVPTGVVQAGVARPNVDLPLAKWNWGTIPRIPTVQQSFPIQNTGNKTLVISSVVTSCGCTTAELSSSVIPPGERADLVVVFDPDYHETSGPVTRLIWLETNDPETPLVELKADANVGT